MSITSPSLHLRKLRREDLDRVRRWRNSPDVATGMLNQHVITPTEHRRWFERILTSPEVHYWVICVENTPAGLVCLYRIDTREGTCEWGFYIAEPTLRGRGIARAALSAVLDYAFGPLALRRIDAEVLCDNAVSISVHRRLGFTRSVAGGDENAVHLSLTAAAWAESRRVAPDAGVTIES